MHRGSNVKMSYNDNHRRNSYSKERELERKRREWMIEQERAREHERRKQKMIREYEERRARELGLKSSSRRSSNRSYSRSRSHSPSTSYSRSKKTEIQIEKDVVMSEKFDRSSSNTRLFKGPEGTKIAITDLKKIKVDIRRNIDAADKTTELQRNIINAEDVVLKRREGEGAKPIFEREELKKSERTSASEVEERRTVVAIGAATSSRRRSLSLSPERRYRDRSPRRDSRREKTSKTLRDKATHRDNSEYRGRSRDIRDRNSMREHQSPGKSDRDRSRDYRSRRSPSDEHDKYHESRRNTSSHKHVSYDSRRQYDDRVRRRMEPPPHHYYEPMPVPFYYGNYARPIMVDPIAAMRGPIAIGRGRMPSMIRNVRPPYPPRFAPLIFRPPGPSNPRF